jgi:hypothetical protein
MKTKLLFSIIVLFSNTCYSQQVLQSGNFIPIPLSSYGNTLNLPYTQTKWYYRSIIEEGYHPNELSVSSRNALNAILDIKPKVDHTRSILDVYKEQDKIFNKFK